MNQTVSWAQICAPSPLLPGAAESSRGGGPGSAGPQHRTGGPSLPSPGLPPTPQGISPRECVSQGEQGGRGRGGGALEAEERQGRWETSVLPSSSECLWAKPGVPEGPGLPHLLFRSLLKEWPLEVYLYGRTFATSQWLLSHRKLKVS